MSTFRDRRIVWQVTPDEEREIVDKDGYYTGGIERIPGEPILRKLCVGPKDMFFSEDLPFGTWTDYSLVMSMSQVEFYQSGISENTEFIIPPRVEGNIRYNNGDLEPKDTDTKYVVKHIAEGVDWVSIGLSEVV